MSGRGPGVAVLAATHMAAMAAGWAVADRRPIDTEVHEGGIFRTSTTEVLATTIESLRDENKLLVFSYKGSARVRADTSLLWLFGGRQELIVPAVVGYYLDLSELSLADVSYDDRAKLVRVTLPPVTLGDIAFQPEGATTINGGVLTYSEAETEALRKLNYAAARRAMVAQAQQPGLVKAARRQAVEDVQNYFEIPLRIAGMPDVKVAASFK